MVIDQTCLGKAVFQMDRRIWIFVNQFLDIEESDILFYPYNVCTSRAGSPMADKAKDFTSKTVMAPMFLYFDRSAVHTSLAHDV